MKDILCRILLHNTKVNRQIIILFWELNNQSLSLFTVTVKTVLFPVFWYM